MLADWFLLVDSALKDFLLNLGLVLGSTPDEELLSFKYCVSTVLVFNKVWHLLKHGVVVNETCAASIVQDYYLLNYSNFNIYLQ